ncbi:glycoside hydrolase family 78 protein [Streptomyces albidus (ex Kaewkla and Franco 2022)]|uniref:glycoside hydrolase family 78 protein n=1 Tax=Streptomyces albidus (ex Kaewkla and Franco 2022) TaxID=722709 RepID=UPI002815E05F|nr:glycoside hydrolase family 78 protein [Streptomyces albidus (ex Kaewkla and Franco 2022)]
MTISPVRFEHLDSALGIGTPSPRLSWQIGTDDPMWQQTAYELELDGTTTVRVDSDEQVLVPWPFEPLPARTRASVRVRVASGDQWTDFSPASTVETGLLEPGDWTGRFISPRTIGAIGERAPILSRSVPLRSGIASARIYATAHGVYAATLNGGQVGEQVLAPGWTSYHNRLRYQTYDVTDLVQEGENTLEVLLGNGWYRGRIGLSGGRRANYGDRLALCAQLEVTYLDGTREVIGTDEEWTARESGIVVNEIYDGQRTDLRGADSRKDGVEIVEADLSRLTAPTGPPVGITEVVAAERVFRSPSGQTLVDFGQNVVGWVRLRVRNTKSGDEVLVHHAEVLENGELGVRPLRTAEATAGYVLADADEAVLEPSLTYHGFRYAQVTGVADLQAADVEAVVVGTQLRRTGWFSCSEPDLERFHENVVWSTRGNFLDIPTDCPQRDERLGWTGDIQVFAPTASFLFDTAGFLDSWLADVAADQHADGSVPWVIPEIPHPQELVNKESPTAAAWGDAAAIVPWVLYQRYHDVGILERQLPSMRGWVDKVASLTTDGVRAGGWQFGDWLDPTAPPDNPFAAQTDPDLVATAHLARSAEIVAETAQLLGREEEAERYASLAARTREAFAREYVTGSGRMLSDAPTAYALALEWALLPEASQRECAARRLADLLRMNGFRISTGFVGTPMITDALTSSGRTDLAYKLLLERGCPSWLYPVGMGATTIWERWDSMLPDGSINPGQMTSFNHYALGAVADWMHRVVAGLAPAAPGYREITVRPRPRLPLTHASARHLTPYGEASVAWQRADGQFSLDVVVPVGTRATVHPPGQEPVTVRHGRHSWTVPDPCSGSEPTPRTVRELMDTVELWPKAVSMLVGHGLVEDAAQVADRAARYLDHPVQSLPRLVAHRGTGERAERACQELQQLLA